MISHNVKDYVVLGYKAESWNLNKELKLMKLLKQVLFNRKGCFNYVRLLAVIE